MRAGRWRRRALVGLVLAVALVAAGCGGNDDDNGSSGAQGGAQTQLQDLITPGTLTVGTELPAPPFWIGDDYDHLTGGFEVDFAKELAKRVGLANVKFVEMPFGALVAGSKCDCDIDFSQVTITPDRDKVVDFTEPYFDANQGVLARKGITVASVDDAKKLQWGAQINTTGTQFLTDKIQPDKETRIFDKTVDAFAALNAGQIQAIMLDTPIVLGAVKEKQVKDAEVVGQFKTGETYGAVVNRGSKNLAAFNTAIKAMKADGFRDQLFKKYFADQAAVPEIPV
jgi:polar amino acid transport system substrate-binding protein